MLHCLCLMAKGRTYVLSSYFWLWKAQGSTMCSEVEGVPLKSFYLFIKSKGEACSGEKQGKKGKEEKDDKVDPNPQPDTDGGVLLNQ